MNGVEILRRLHGAGLQVWRGQDGRILVSPHRRLTPELADRVREHRAAVLDALPTEEQAARVREYARILGAGGAEWSERLLRFLTREAAADVLRWLDRRTVHEDRASVVRRGDRGPRSVFMQRLLSARKHPR